MESADPEEGSSAPDPNFRCLRLACRRGNGPGTVCFPEGRRKYDTFRGPRPVRVESLDEKKLYSLGRMEALFIDAEIFDEWEKGVVTVEDYDRILWKEEESNEKRFQKI